MSRVSRAVIAGALFLAFAGPASAAPCWKTLTTDWAANGTVDRTYPIPCYRQAVARLEPDLEIYSSAREDILRALQRTIASHGGGTPIKRDVAPAAHDGGNSVPLPLELLGGLAILLVAAGAGGMIWRRTRRPNTP